MSAPKGRILCTEDDADIRDLIITILQMEGYEVICAGSAEETLNLAKTEKFRSLPNGQLAPFDRIEAHRTDSRV